MEVLPKIFADKFSPYSSFAVLKLFALIISTGLLSTFITPFSQFLGEVVFFVGGSIITVVMMGFASVKRYEERKPLTSTNPFLMQIVSSPVFSSMSAAFHPISKIMFILVFHIFLAFALLIAVFPFIARWYGS